MFLLCRRITGGLFISMCLDMLATITEFYIIFLFMLVRIEF